MTKFTIFILSILANEQEHFLTPKQIFSEKKIERFGNHMRIPGPFLHIQMAHSWPYSKASLIRSNRLLSQNFLF